MVSQFTQPDNTSQDAGTYKGAIDDSVSVMARLAGAFAPHEQATPNMTVRLDVGFVFNGQTLTEVAAQSSATITAPTTNPRIDRIHVDGGTGVVGIATGAEAASPSAPAIPAGTIPVAQVSLTVGMSQITNGDLTDERVTQLGAASGQLVLIESQNVTSATATIDFETGIDATYDTYLFEISGIQIDTDEREIAVRIGTGGTPTYQATTYDYAIDSINSVQGGLSNLIGANHDSVPITFDTSSAGQTLGSAAGESLNGSLRLYAPADIGLYTNMSFHTAYSRAIDGSVIRLIGSSAWRSTTAVTAVRFFLNGTGNLDGGRITSFGVKHI